MRKILYSPGYGAGWVSWHYGTREENMFMLEYQPFIEALERGEPIGDALIEKFRADWSARFPKSEPPYVGGLCTLKVLSVPDGARVRISEYDGNESVAVEGSDEGWL